MYEHHKIQAIDVAVLMIVVLVIGTTMIQNETLYKTQLHRAARVALFRSLAIARKRRYYTTYIYAVYVYYEITLSRLQSTTISHMNYFFLIDIIVNAHTLKLKMCPSTLSYTICTDVQM